MKGIWAVVCLELKTHLCKTVFDFIVEFIEEVDGEDVAVESGWEVVEVAECQRHLEQPQTNQQVTVSVRQG